MKNLTVEDTHILNQSIAVVMLLNKYYEGLHVLMIKDIGPTVWKEERKEQVYSTMRQ